jgi:excisionase family DNA binding protein
MSDVEPAQLGGLSDPKWQRTSLFIPREAAEVLGLCDEVVRMAINAGQIPVTTIGRQRYIARGTLARIIAGEAAAIAA